MCTGSGCSWPLFDIHHTNLLEWELIFMKMIWAIPGWVPDLFLRMSYTVSDLFSEENMHDFWMISVSSELETCSWISTQIPNEFFLLSFLMICTAPGYVFDMTWRRSARFPDVFLILSEKQLYGFCMSSLSLFFKKIWIGLVRVPNKFSDGSCSFWMSLWSYFWRSLCFL